MKKHVGNVGVDAGLVWIGDPCYVLHKEGKKRYKSIGKDWCDFCDLLGKDYPAMKSFNYDVGHEGLGVCLSSGLGDGCYPVVAEVREVITDDGHNLGIRVLNAKITFLKDEEKLAICYGDWTTASRLVAYLGDDIVGEKIKTLPMGEWEGGDCEIIELFPEEFDANIVMQVKRLSDGEEMGIFHDETVMLLKE